MKKTKKLSLVEVVSMAVGTMIGASIFSIFGLGAKVAGHDLPGAFLLSGMYALVVAYSYSILGSKIITNAGPIGFILKGLGDSLVTGMLSILFWLSYVVSISLLAKGFTGYFLPLLHLDNSYMNFAIVETILISFFVFLNFFGSKAVGKSEIFIVFTKITILFIFILSGIWTIKYQNLVPSFSSTSNYGLLNASVIFFLSYIGFGIITNASENLRDPEKNIPKAIYSSIFIVLAVYVLISVVTLGNLSLQKVITAKENAIAVAAQPFLGNFGFFLISIGALFSIASALNATIFGGSNIAYALAKDGELPDFFERKVWFKSTEGLFITAGLGLFFALSFNLGDIATITSCVYTIVYIFVVISHIRLRKKLGGNIIILVFNLTVLGCVFFALLNYQWNFHRIAFFGTAITFLFAFIVEYIFRNFRYRHFVEHKKNNFNI